MKFFFRSESWNCSSILERPMCIWISRPHVWATRSVLETPITKVQDHNEENPFFFNIMTIVSSFSQHRSKQNVILVDDSAFKARLNPFYSSLYPPEYPPQYQGGEEDDVSGSTLFPLLQKLSLQRQTMSGKWIRAALLPRIPSKSGIPTS